MDKIQIYYTILIITRLLVTMILGAQKPYDSVGTWKDRLLFYPLDILISLPTIGRIYGWW